MEAKLESLWFPSGMWQYDCTMKICFGEVSEKGAEEALKSAHYYFSPKVLYTKLKKQDLKWSL